MTVTKISRNELSAIAAPAGTRTWAPIPHTALLEEVSTQLKFRGIDVMEERHEIARDGESYFGKLRVAGDTPEASWMLGLRNDNGQRFPAGFCLGEQVTVCSNLMFTGEIQFARKHTRYILRDLPGMISEGLDRWVDAKVVQNERVEKYKHTALTDRVVPQLLIRSMEEGVISSSQIGKVWGQWKAPAHEEFEPRNAWSVQNAYTEVLKEVNPMSLPKRTVALTGLLDRMCEVLN